MRYRETTQEALENHDKNLENLLKRCRENNIKLNKKKAKFQMTEVKFMGQILRAGFRQNETFTRFDMRKTSVTTDY